MYQNYDNAVDEINKHLIKNHYSKSVISNHASCYRSFKQYLEQKQLPYSFNVAMKWLNDNKPRWQHSKFKAFRLYLYRLNDIIQKECPPTNSYVYENSRNYARLPNWCRVLLDDHLKEFSEASISDGYVSHRRIACSEFLIFITSTGDGSVEDINYKNIVEYYNQSAHLTIQAKNHYNRHIRHFLEYLASRELIQGSLPHVLKREVIPRVILINDLSESERTGFCLIDNTIEDVPPSDYYAIAREFGETYLNLHKYSKSTRNTFVKAWRDLYIFLEANKLSYSYAIAEYWCVLLKNSNCQWKSYRRALKLLEHYRCFGILNPGIVFSYKEVPISSLPEWSRSLLQDFLSIKQNEENTVSTVNIYRTSCLRFLRFLEKKNIRSCSAITPGIIKEFHITDAHSTAEARNAYSVRIRGFLNYLANRGYVPLTLPLALTTQKAAKSSIVEILTDEEIAAIYSFMAKAESPMELRNIAIVLLGLRLGLRACDIVGLKFQSISWNLPAISVQQQKTNKFIKLPMPVDVGNSLFRYIMNGRPCSPSNYIFINHRVPYDKLNVGCCRRALKEMLNKPARGFHITRKTFASRMLRNKTNTDTIAESLGHSNNSTVLKYLATDSNTMRKCALSLRGIELEGGMLS